MITRARVARLGVAQRKHSSYRYVAITSINNDSFVAYRMFSAVGVIDGIYHVTRAHAASPLRAMRAGAYSPALSLQNALARDGAPS